MFDLKYRNAAATDSSVPKRLVRTASGLGMTQTESWAPGGNGSESIGVGGGGFMDSQAQETPSQHRVQNYTPINRRLLDGNIVDKFRPTTYVGMIRLCQKIIRDGDIEGTIIEMYSQLPWSDVTLGGVDDPRALDIYHTGLENTKVVERLPVMTSEYLAIGRVVGHLILDEAKGNWRDLILHDSANIRIKDVNIVGSRPILDLVPTALRRTIMSAHTDPRIMREVSRLPRNIINLVAAGHNIPLPPAHTIFLPRRTHMSDVVGTSMFTRILKYIAMENALTDATLSGLYRMAGPLAHIKVGDAEDEPDQEELDHYVQLLMAAEADPIGCKIATPSHVNIEMLQYQGQVENIKEYEDFLRTGKATGLGVSDAFVTGEAQLHSLSNARAIFMDRLKAIQSLFATQIIRNAILAPLAKLHGIRKTTRAQTSHRIRIYKHGRNRLTMSELALPSIAWRRNLGPSADMEYLQLLQFLEDRGVSIPLKAFADAAGYDLATSIEGYKEDIKLRTQFDKIRQSYPLDQQNSDDDMGFASFRQASPRARVSRIEDALRRLPLFRDGSFLELPIRKAAIAISNRMEGHGTRRSGLNPNQEDLLDLVASRVGLPAANEIDDRTIRRAAGWVQGNGPLTSQISSEIAKLNNLSSASIIDAESSPSLGGRKRGRLPSHQLLTGLL